MDIKEEVIKYTHDFPCEVKLCRISHLKPHYHSKELEFIFCLEGSVELVAGHQNTLINAGEIFSVDYRDIHYVRSDRDNLVLIFHLDLTRLAMSWEHLQYVFFACESSHCYPHQQKAMEKVKDTILSLALILCEDTVSEHERIQCQSAADGLIHIMFKYFNWYNYENRDEHTNIELYGRFHRVLAYCNNNYMNKISVDHLAQQEHLDKNYFSQFISKTVFESFSLMVKYIRCYEAEHLLLKTDMPIAEISYACGFSDPKYFYSAFRHYWGCTPTQHRHSYADVLKKNANAEIISQRQCRTILIEQIAKWHVEKTLADPVNNNVSPMI